MSAVKSPPLQLVGTKGSRRHKRTGEYPMVNELLSGGSGAMLYCLRPLTVAFTNLAPVSIVNLRRKLNVVLKEKFTDQVWRFGSVQAACITDYTACVD